MEQAEMDGARDGEVLNAAIIAGDLEKVRALLDAGISVTQPDHFRQLPMFVAARDGKEAIISLLLDRGVDVNAPVLDGRTPLYYAAAHGRPEAVRVLLSRGATVDVLDSYGQTPLLAATTSLSNES
ncbi:MAG: ankyrin repeat domain-containing protein, partial [Alphaproteobacteria bacterium]|nr:ankyrin repeat domain-containing protein [Alphaproteobacteria bacterium]